MVSYVLRLCCLLLILLRQLLTMFVYVCIIYTYHHSKRNHHEHKIRRTLCHISLFFLLYTRIVTIPVYFDVITKIHRMINFLKIKILFLKVLNEHNIKNWLNCFYGVLLIDLHHILNIQY